jgi:O-antigen/teichoic acid export membrane protein
VFALSGFLATSVFKDPSASSFIRIGSALILINSLNVVLMAFFRMQMKIWLYTVLGFVTGIVQMVGAMTVLLLGYKLTGLIISNVFIGLFFDIIAVVIILRSIGFRFPRFTNMKSYLKWGVPLTPNSAIFWVTDVSDRYLVSYFMGINATGIYNAAYSIGQYANFFVSPVQTVLYPSVIKAYNEGNIEEAKNYLKYSLRYTMMISIPAAFGLSILAKPLLTILTTSEFVIGSAVVPFVAAGVLFLCFYQICIYVFHLVGKTSMTARLLGACALLNIIINIILIPRIGIIGAALATLIAYGVLGTLTLAVTRRYLKFDLSTPFIAKSIVASLVMIFCIWLIQPASIITVLISILAGAVIYCAMLLVLRALSHEELTFFVSFAKSHIPRHTKPSAEVIP